MIRQTTLRHGCWLAAMVGISLGVGCRGHQYGHVVQEDGPDMVGSHTAGAATFNPLIDDAVAQLLGRQSTGYQQVSHMTEGMPVPQRIQRRLENKIRPSQHRTPDFSSWRCAPPRVSVRADGNG